MNKSEAIERAKKLLQLGQSDNEYESALAIGQATALMEEYKITEACMVEKSDSEEEMASWDDPLAQSGRRWQRDLARVLTTHNGCSYWIRPGKGATIHIVGRASNVQTVRYLFQFCVKEIDRLAERRMGNGRTWINNYRIGCVEAIDAAIKEESEALHDRMRGANTGSELMVINNAITIVAAEHEEAKTFGRRKLGLRTGRAQGSTYNSNARATGRKDGASIYQGGSGSKRVGGGVRRLN